MIGKLLGHYRVVEKLGAGGMGVVYKARDTHLDRFVALKVLSPERVVDAERKRRFVQEAKAASALNHPNIIHVYDIAEADGIEYIAMEYVQGRTLDRLVGSKGLGIDEALGYAVQIADGLAKAHAAGIVHRDLKPANIMVNEDGGVKILDFGLAKLLEGGEPGPSAPTETAAGGEAPHTEKGVIVGTVAYMSPEQAQGKSVDTRSDIFSFGSVLYEMLTGRHAFQGESKAMTLASILQKEPQPVREIVTDAPPEVERVLARCLRKDPQRRWQSMSDLKEVLHDLKEESDSGKLSRTVPVAPRRSFPFRWSLATACVLLVVAAMLWHFLHKPLGALQPTRFTYDSGLTSAYSISPDGKLAAYVSDRNDPTNLDIYVRQLGGRQDIQLTHDKADDLEPCLSPDGTQVVFRSMRNGGGIYRTNTFGGEEQKIADDGWFPRYSPDGLQIIYTVMPPSGGTFLNKMYLIPTQGGIPRPFQPEFGVVPTFGSHPLAVWSPDGKHVLFHGVRKGDPSSADWWVAPVDGGTAVRTGAVQSLRSTDAATWIRPSGWFGNQVIYAEGSSVAEGCNLFAVPINPGDWKISGVSRRLTSSPGLNLSFTPAHDGSMLVNNTKGVAEIWSLPLDPGKGTLSGEPRLLPTEEISKMSPSISRDGSRLAYFVASLRPRPQGEMRLRDMAGGSESSFTLRGTQLIGVGPRLNANGSLVAYRDFINGKWNSFLYDGKSTPSRQVCEGCTFRSFLSNPNEVLVQYGNEVVRQNTVSGERSVILGAGNGTILDADLSPDDRWVAGLMGRPSGGNAIFVTPVRASSVPMQDWILIADDERAVLDSPRWSADGGLLYFISWRDGRPCIWAQRLHGETRRPLGDAVEIYHEDRARYGVYGPPRYRTISVARDKLVTLMIECTGNIWSANLLQR